MKGQVVISQKKLALADQLVSFEETGFPVLKN
jgi:hypothetical protein